MVDFDAGWFVMGLAMILAVHRLGRGRAVVAEGGTGLEGGDLAGPAEPVGAAALDRQFCADVSSVLEKRFPSLERRVQADVAVLWSREVRVRVPLGPLRARVASDPDRAARAVEHLLAEVERAVQRPVAPEVSREAVLGRVVPVLLAPDCVDRADGGRRVLVRVAPGVDAGFVLDEPMSGFWVTAALAERLELSAESLWGRALENLRGKSEGAVVLQDAAPGREVYRFEQGDGLDGSRLLLRSAWEQVSEHCGAELVLCAPVRDRAYAAPVSQPASLDRMSGILVGDWNSRPHAVSPGLWVWRDGALAPWERHG